jgi:hypothetical protein
VKSPAARNALLLVGSDAGVNVWTDDKVILRHDVGRGAKIDEDKVRFHLRQGWKLLFKIMQGEQVWGLAARNSGDDLLSIESLEADPLCDLPLVRRRARMLRFRAFALLLATHLPKLNRI